MQALDPFPDGRRHLKKKLKEHLGISASLAESPLCVGGSHAPVDVVLVLFSVVRRNRGEEFTTVAEARELRLAQSEPSRAHWLALSRALSPGERATESRRQSRTQTTFKEIGVPGGRD
ncbi:unnamed protein product [Arctogadus glacialis]